MKSSAVVILGAGALAVIGVVGFIAYKNVSTLAVVPNAPAPGSIAGNARDTVDAIGDLADSIHDAWGTIGGWFTQPSGQTFATVPTVAFLV